MLNALYVQCYPCYPYRAFSNTLSISPSNTFIATMRASENRPQPSIVAQIGTESTNARGERLFTFILSASLSPYKHHRL